MEGRKKEIGKERIKQTHEGRKEGRKKRKTVWQEERKKKE